MNDIQRPQPRSGGDQPNRNRAFLPILLIIAILAALGYMLLATDDVRTDRTNPKGTSARFDCAQLIAQRNLSATSTIVLRGPAGLSRMIIIEDEQGAMVAFIPFSEAVL